MALVCPRRCADSNILALLPSKVLVDMSHTHFTDNIVRVGLNYQFH
jgi:hypothetical protein